MTRFSWFGYEAEVDEAATAAWYAQAEDWGCACGHCQNFLALARERMRLGQNATEACFSCGFSSYSAFLRAYKRQFGETPRKLKGHVTRNN